MLQNFGLLFYVVEQRNIIEAAIDCCSPQYLLFFLLVKKLEGYVWGFILAKRQDVVSTFTYLLVIYFESLYYRNGTVIMYSAKYLFTNYVLLQNTSRWLLPTLLFCSDLWKFGLLLQNDFKLI